MNKKGVIWSDFKNIALVLVILVILFFVLYKYVFGGAQDLQKECLSSTLWYEEAFCFERTAFGEEDKCKLVSDDGFIDVGEIKGCPPEKEPNSKFCCAKSRFTP